MSGKYEELVVANLHKVNEGMVIKNYKELCKLFCFDIKSGKSKSLQLKQLKRYINLQKEGVKYIVIEIYKEPIKLIDGRRGNVKHLSITNPYHYSYVVDDYNYSKDKIHATASYVVKWECSICDSHFDRNIYNVCKYEMVRCNNCVSSTGEKLVAKILRQLELNHKREIKFKDLKGIGGMNLRFDFGVYNDDKLICLIEYDGSFHDTLDRIKIHDNIKNEYCKVNNIPLLRIHYKVDSKDVKMIIVRFIYELHKTDKLKELINIDDEISKYKNYLDLLKNEMLNINDKILELESKIQ